MHMNVCTCMSCEAPCTRRFKINYIHVRVDTEEQADDIVVAGSNIPCYMTWYRYTHECKNAMCMHDVHLDYSCLFKIIT